MSVGLVGCAGSAPVSAPPLTQAIAPLTSGPDPFGDSVAVPFVRAKDRISVKVMRENELSLDSVRIGEDGYFDMPYIGRVLAEGRSTAQISEDIRERLGRSYLVDPRVAVNVVDYASHTVTVDGTVTQPGIYQFQPDATLTGAIAMARGPMRTAKLNQIVIFRKQGEERSVAVFDLKQIRAGTMIDPELIPGDRVVVGFSGMSQAWQDFLQTVPLIAIFTRI